MAIVDLTYYTDEYLGEAISPELFPRLELRAEESISAVTRGALDDFAEFSDKVQTLIKKAICSQTEYLAIYGADVGYSVSDVGFSTGKFHIDGATQSEATNKFSLMICPRAVMFLEQAGLLSRRVGVIR